MTQPPVVAGVRISHPDRVVYPDLGITKLALAQVYAAIAHWIVPHVTGRPLTLVHCPVGMAGACTYMRHRRVWGPTPLRRVRIQEKTKLGEYLVADDASAVVALIQMGVLEIHTWNATDDDIERPNRIVWDLDPGEATEWSQVIDAARAVRDLLAALGLESWVKTTGGRGLHVVVPIVRHRDWSECLAFARAVAGALTRSRPDLYTMTFAKRGREAQILIDYLRNNRTNTTIAAFSTRARAGATLSYPLGWHELTPRLRPDQFTVMNVRQKLARRKDPWRDYWSCRQRVSKAAFEAMLRL